MDYQGTCFDIVLENINVSCSWVYGISAFTLQWHDVVTWSFKYLDICGILCTSWELNKNEVIAFQTLEAQGIIRTSMEKLLDRWIVSRR